MNHKRPVNLDLGSLKYPPMAIASILHRISGLVLFLFLPGALYFFHLSLASAASFDYLHMILTYPCCKLLVWIFSTALIYHALAGVRHMCMDMGLGEGLSAGRRSAMLVIVLAMISAILLGIRLW